MRFVLIILAFLPLAALADDRPDPGLMWNRTGLPLTFPLQVKTAPGADYIVTLRDAETGDPALAAYIRGGQFFRVLVPPGTYNARFDYGTVWQGDQAGFADQKTLTLKDALTFEIRGIGRKAGHLVDLTGMDLDRSTASAPQVRDQALCQVAQSEIRSNCPLGDKDCAPPRDADGYASPYGIKPRYTYTYNSYTRLCD